MNENKMILKDLFCPTLSTRQSVDELSKKLSVDIDTKTVIDFEGIEFVSRSFAHEFLRFEEKHFVEVKNISSEVENMFQSVRRTRSSTTHEDIASGTEEVYLGVVSDH